VCANDGFYVNGLREQGFALMAAWTTSEQPQCGGVEWRKKKRAQQCSAKTKKRNEGET